MRYVLLLITLSAALLWPKPACAAEIWKIASLYWPPYSGGELAEGGASVQRLRDALKPFGVKLEVTYLPWARARMVARTGDYVGYFPAWPEEVDDGFIASVPVEWSSVAVMVRKDSNIRADELREVFGHRVGLVKTYDYPETVTAQAARRPHNVDRTPNEELLFKKLSEGRIDAAITDPKVMLHIASRSGVATIRVLRVLGHRPLVLALRDLPGTTARLRLLREAMNRLDGKAASPITP